MLSGKFVRFQTRLTNARTNSTARSAISHVGQRGRRGALETSHNECEPKKAEQSSKAVPAIHKIPASPKVSLGAAVYARPSSNIGWKRGYPILSAPQHHRQQCGGSEYQNGPRPGALVC